MAIKGKCDFPNCESSAEFIIGVSKAYSNKAEKIIGAVCSKDVRQSIDKIMGQCFGTVFWVTIYDLEHNLLYHSFNADKDGFTAGAGWEIFLEEQNATNSDNHTSKNKRVQKQNNDLLDLF